MMSPFILNCRAVTNIVWNLEQFPSGSLSPLSFSQLSGPLVLVKKASEEKRKRWSYKHFSTLFLIFAVEALRGQI
jgi:hypothetical protein